MSDLRPSLSVPPDPERLPGACCNRAEKPGVPRTPQHERSLRLVRQGAESSPARRFSRPFSSVTQNGLSARHWVTVVTAAAVVMAVAIVIAALWAGIGDSDISSAGWFAMGLGIVVTLALGIGLVALVFVSNRRGYDELGRRDS